MSSNGKKVLEFGEFRLDADSGSLWRNGVALSIPPKAIDTLVLLATNPGEIISREKLLETVWKGTFVEEGNINYTISLLRKALGEQEFIQTVPRRGYRFVGAIRTSPDIAARSLADHLAVSDRPSRGFRLVFIGAFAVGLSLLTSFIFFGAKKAENKQIESETANAEAMQAYTRGKMILETKNAERRQERAIDEFRKAITLDPTFALAYVGLGDAFSAQAVKASYPENRDLYSKAKSAAEKAASLDNGLAEAWSLRGWIKRNADWDFVGAESDLRRAVELAPKNAMAHYRLAYLLSSLGKLDEGLAEIELANELDPISDFIQAGRSPILEARGEYDLALKYAEDFLRENKGNSNAKRAVATFAYHKRDFARVIELAEADAEFADNAFAWLSLAASAYSQTKQSEQAAITLAELENMAKSDTKALYSLAMNYAEIGRAGDAIAALEKCLELREERMVWIKTEPRFAGLREDEGFRAIIARMKL